MFTGTDWIVVIGAMGAGLATVVGAYAVARKPRDAVAEQPFRPAPIKVELGEEDREMIREQIGGLKKAIEEHGDIVGKHRHAVGDQTAEIRRGKK